MFPRFKNYEAYQEQVEKDLNIPEEEIYKHAKTYLMQAKLTLGNLEQTPEN